MAIPTNLNDISIDGLDKSELRRLMYHISNSKDRQTHSYSGFCEYCQWTEVFDGHEYKITEMTELIDSVKKIGFKTVTKSHKEIIAE